MPPTPPRPRSARPLHVPGAPFDSAKSKTGLECHAVDENLCSPNGVPQTGPCSIGCDDMRSVLRLVGVGDTSQLRIVAHTFFRSFKGEKADTLSAYDSAPASSFERMPSRRWMTCITGERGHPKRPVPVFGPHNGVVTDLRLALCQSASSGDPQANLEKGLAACSRAAEEGADIAILPEMWQIGYAPCPDDEAGRARWQEMAIARHDPWVSAFRKAASDLNLAIVATFLERWPGSPRNTALLIDRHGQDVLCYAKVHTCDWGMEKALTPGESFEVARLDIEGGFVDVGVMICC